MKKLYYVASDHRSLSATGRTSQVSAIFSNKKDAEKKKLALLPEYPKNLLWVSWIWQSDLGKPNTLPKEKLEILK